MFTGIIQKKVKVVSTTELLGNKKVSLEIPEGYSFELGESVSLDGVCSTVAEISEKNFSVLFMKETLDKTTCKSLVADKEVNLERSLEIGEKINGHFVYGHIDSLGIIQKIKKEEGSSVFTIELPLEFMKYVAYKGSVAVNGVSLTVSKVLKNSFEVSLIPYTLKETTFSQKKVGDLVNIETDILSRYAEKLLASAK